MPIWSQGHERQGLEHVVLAEGHANSVLLAIAEDGEPFRLSYRLAWDQRGRIRQADLEVRKGLEQRSLELRADGEGHWHQAQGQPLPELDGCIDVDIWPTPLTNSLPIWRSNLQIGQRQGFRMAWISAPELTVEPKQQSYLRLRDRLYVFESLDGSGFRAELPVDEDGIVTDYPNLFVRITS